MKKTNKKRFFDLLSKAIHPKSSQKEPQKDDVVVDEVKVLEEDIKKMENDSPVLSMLLNDSTSQMTVLSAVDGSDSSGFGLRLVKDGVLNHAVAATLPNLQEGSVYEGWLVQTDPLVFFSTGLLNQQEDGSWALEFVNLEVYPTYLKVVITLETEVDETPEKHIIEGSF